MLWVVRPVSLELRGAVGARATMCGRGIDNIKATGLDGLTLGERRGPEPHRELSHRD